MRFIKITINEKDEFSGKHTTYFFIVSEFISLEHEKPNNSDWPESLIIKFKNIKFFINEFNFNENEENSNILNLIEFLEGNDKVFTIDVKGCVEIVENIV